MTKKTELYRREGKYIYFGRWPQTEIDKSISVMHREGDKEWIFRGSDGELYFKSRKHPKVLDKTYFKIEPIKWRILDEKDGVALLLSEHIIDAEFYGGHNCYCGSVLEEWINGHFYDTAFTDAERELILVSQIDNSVESTGLDENADACRDCEGHIFLLSYKEAFESYGLTDEDRMKKATDYAKSRWGEGGCTNEWYLRSPEPCHFSDEVRAVFEDGTLSTVYIAEWCYSGSDGSDGATTGVVPAVRIKL